MKAWPAPAKINHFLHVVGRRADGYHLLQTVFGFLDYGDTLYFDVREDGQVILDNPLPGVPADSDLTVRAARLLQARTGVKLGASIRLEKRLPMGGGLGGGSSDAATTLLALNHLWQAGLSRHELEMLGLQLGADVPIFVHGHAAFAEGVGEAFTDVVLPEAWYLVLIPPVGVPTQAIFGAPELRRDTPVIAPSDWHPGMGGNDLEPVAVGLYPQVGAYLDLLRPYGAPRMSGSGACVFVAFANEADARAAQTELPVDVRNFVAYGLTEHPLSELFSWILS
ncbi:MAG TPA: 4-(cytidine 5'-diphospho)-2-C-methyl-D-erythritol kinase [Rhodocyclaceae bacterium]|nr:4-(cytidine 5'-diphospho)-2-C-methyl-D-erythritol kinase [Rhodocyclaceae bacterium]